MKKFILILLILFFMTRNKLENMADVNVINDIKRLLKIDFDNIINLNNAINKLNEGTFNINELYIEGKLNFLPKGSIVMWTQNQIPKGWLMCNGQNGTPDLRNRFIVGAGDKYKLRDVSGVDKVVLNEGHLPEHTHSVSCKTKRTKIKLSGFTFKKEEYFLDNHTDLAGEHSHNVDVRESQANVRGRSGESILTWHEGDVTSTVNGNHQHKCNININNNGGNQAHDNLPPYFSLIYIMREI